MKTQRRPRSKADPLLELQIPAVGEDHTLPHEKWNEDLTILVPNSDAILEGFTITLTVNTVPYGDPHTVSPTEAGDASFLYEFTLKSSDFPAGNPLAQYALNYEVHNPVDQITLTSPYRYILLFDKEPPGGITLPYLGFTAEQLQGIYPTDFIDDQLTVRLSPWQKMAAGDTLLPWLASAPPDEGNADSGLLNDAIITIGPDEVGRPVSVKFPRTALEALGDIPQFFGYQLKDKFGNTSAISPARRIEVHLQGTDSVRPPSTTKVARRPRVVRRLQNPELFQGRIEGLRERDGRIQVNRLSAPIDFIVPMPPVPIPGNHAQLSLNEKLIGSAQPVDETAPEFILQINPGDLPDSGEPFDIWQVDYNYSDPVSGNDNFSGKPVQLITDRRAPGGIPPVPPIIAFTPEQLAGITESDLDPNEDGLVAHISAWYDDDYDDQVELWLGTGPTEADGNYLTSKPGPVSDPAAGLQVVFPRADLLQVGSNPVYFGYRVTDWAGNISDLSEITPINVYLAGVPGDLEPPLIPDAAPYNPLDGSNTPPGTGMLIWTEANPTTTVQIPTYLNVAANDRVYILWDNAPTLPVTVTQEDIDNADANGYLLEILLPFQYVRDGTQGANIPIRYRIGPISGSPFADSPPQYIRINLETPGGPDIDPIQDTPEHENMRPPVVLSDYPGSSNNVIPPAAYTSNAKLTVARAGVDNKVIWQVGDTLQIYWRDTTPPNPALIPITTTNESSNIIVPIPADLIDSKGVGEIPVYYELTRDLGDSNFVSARSPSQTVTVQSPGQLPGGNNDLKVADFPESIPPVGTSRFRVLQRAPALDGSMFRIPLQDDNGVTLENVAAGDFISFDFYGVLDPLDGPGHDEDPLLPPIEASRIKVDDYVIRPEDITRGYYEVPLPFSKINAVCRNLTVTEYSIKNAIDRKHAPKTLILFAVNQGGLPCTVS